MVEQILNLGLALAGPTSVSSVVSPSHRSAHSPQDVNHRLKVHMGAVCVCVCVSFTKSLVGFLGGLAGKASACSAGDPGLIPGLGKSTRERIGHPLRILGLPWWLSW